MGNHSAKRRVNHELQVFCKTHLKQKISKLALLGLKEKNKFICTFKQCYPDIWKIAKIYHHECSLLENRRKIHKKSSVYPFKTCEYFFWFYAKRIVGSKRKSQITETSQDKIQKLIKAGKARKLSFDQKGKVRNRLLQITTPQYISYYEWSYFYLRKHYPQDIDSRYLILHEASKYKSDKTVSFLSKISSCERNDSLRKFAFESLQRMGVTNAKIGGKRKGKPRILDNVTFNPVNTPKDLLRLIYNSPLEQMKKYDLFLSHSYRDADALVELKNKLNRLDINVYLDWVNDKDELKRNLACVETAKVLVERIKSSKAIMYVHTKDSLKSQWTPWELGLAFAYGKKVCVLYVNEDAEVPEYLGLYDKVEIENGNFLITERNKEGNIVALKDWIQK